MRCVWWRWTLPLLSKCGGASFYKEQKQIPSQSIFSIGWLVRRTWRDLWRCAKGTVPRIIGFLSIFASFWNNAPDAALSAAAAKDKFLFSFFFFPFSFFFFPFLFFFFFFFLPFPLSLLFFSLFCHFHFIRACLRMRRLLEEAAELLMQQVSRVVGPSLNKVS